MFNSHPREIFCDYKVTCLSSDAKLGKMLCFIIQ